MRTGVDRNTGELLTGWAECAQSIGIIVTTAIGSLVLGRDFGSDGPTLQDRPMSTPSIMDHFMAIAESLRKWEPGFKLRRIDVLQTGGDGVIGFAIVGDFYPNGHLGDYSIVETAQTTQIAPFLLTAEAS
jgi:uncharacterized protein